MINTQFVRDKLEQIRLYYQELEQLISRLNLSSPDDFQSTFKILAENKIFPERFAEKIAPVIGLRNRLVHRYEKIDLNLMLKQAQAEREDFKEYVKLIENYLSTNHQGLKNNI